MTELLRDPATDTIKAASSTLSRWPAWAGYAAFLWSRPSLDIDPYFERPGYIEFRIGDYQHELGLIDSDYAPEGAATNPGGAIAYWHVDDLEATFEKASVNGRRRASRTHRTWGGDYYRFRGRPLWKHLRHHVQSALLRNTGETMKTQYYTATSINGYLVDKDNSLDWLFQFGEINEIEGVQDNFPQFVDQVGALAMGSTTYEWIVEHENLLEDPEQWPYEDPVWVFSSRELPMVDGADIRFAQGDVAPVHAEMVRAANGKNVWLVGGGDLVGQFHDNGLLDEIILSVAPVTLASGAPLLPRRITNPPLRLTDVQKHGDVFAELTYEVQHSSQG